MNNENAILSKSVWIGEMIEVHIEICREEVQLPEYANDWDAGLDVRSAKDIIIYPGETKIIPTGLKVAIPKGYEIQVRPRSGLSLNTPLRVSNSPGTIDTNYRDEIGIIITNTSLVKQFSTNDVLGGNQYPITEYYKINDKGNKQGIYHIQKNNRIAQLVLQKVPRIKWNKIDDITKIEGDRGGGFGSTGT
jgi:dUTP pyrophosphatase